MRNPLRRYYGSGDLHFITFSCYRRHPLLGTRRARNRFVRILDEVRARHGFRLIGYVVMPEHVHLLVSEPRKITPSKVLQVLKQKVSRALRGRGRKKVPGQLSLAFAAAATEERAFWQRRFYDFNVWSSKKVREKLEYMHANPVKRKLVMHPKDWPWSSWSYYAKGDEGLIRIDPVDGSETAKTEQKTEKEKARSRTAPLNPKGAAPETVSPR
jgi:putative transposase